MRITKLSFLCIELIDEKDLSNLLQVNLGRICRISILDIIHK